MFGSKLQQIQIYAQLLAGAGVERGLIGPAEKARLWDRHLLNSGAVAELVSGMPAGPGALPPAESHVVAPRASGARADAASRGWTKGLASPESVKLADLGSGAGLPGLVLAIMLPEVQVILVEPMARRARFLHECVAELALGNVEVRRARAEELAGEIQADVVTARAVASLGRLAVLAAALARPGGLVLAIKGASAGQELDRALPVLRELHVTEAEIVAAGAGLLDCPTTVVRFRTGPDLVPGRRSQRGHARASI